MLEAVVSVVRVSGGIAWVEAEQRSACGHCASAGHCATGVLGSLLGRRRRLLAIDNRLHSRVGDRVVVGISDSQLSGAAAAAFLVPMLCLLLPAALADATGLGNVAVALSGGAGLVVGLLGLAALDTRAAGLRRLHVLRREPPAVNLSTIALRSGR